MSEVLIKLLTRYREWQGEKPGITEVFLAALGTEGTAGFQCELGFGNSTTKSFQSDTLEAAVYAAYQWVRENYYG